ncbi:SpoIIE family protein phosphatase [Nocardioides sp. CER19]|uniref:SpoIIE family protein phosphatase n=1 Tax=Nocardioides sp. CER19 TaxID=3038538 RepID=UPI00244A11A9|nr:SpoIIE family protein phosphatase [Nocardioides sp. CER19]MDH2412852.1 SpoIIE family protein phosphatase [Nocardioides sp. CER19]
MTPEEHGRGRDDGSTGVFTSNGRTERPAASGATRLSRHARIPALDGLAALATRVIGVASARVSPAGDVSTVIGSAGLEGPQAAAESLCSLVAATGQLVRIEDAVADDRLDHLPPAARQAVRSYLGVPLDTAGVVLGVLCVYEPVPRHWTDDDVMLLTSLAHSAAIELELAAVEQDERTLWQLAVDAGEVGAFDWDLVTGELRWDERLLELFGLDHATFGGTIEAFKESVHPEDRDRVTEALTEAVKNVGAYAAEYRVLLPDGELRWIAARGRAVAGPDGRAVRLLGAASDTTAVRAEETRVARVLESMPSAFFSLDRSWHFTYANGEAKRLLGGIGADIVGGDIWQLFPAAVGSEFERQYRHAMETNEPVTFEAYYPPPLDAYYEVRGWPTPDGLSVYFLDVTAHHQAQETLARASRRSRLSAEVAAALAETWDADAAVARLAQLLVPELGQWCIVTLTDRGEISPVDWRRGLRDVGWWHADPAASPLVRRYSEKRLGALTDDSFFARALHDSAPVVVAQNAADAVASVLRDGEARDLLLRLDPGAVLCIPMRARGRTLGVLSVFRGRSQPSFSAEDVAVAREVGDRAGLALDNARLYAEQRDLAEQLQRSMMTAPPEPDHLHVAVRYEPAAEVAQVGGDWYDAFVQGDATVVVIGDVIGHDTAAAAAMGQLRNILRGVAVATHSSPAELLRQVDTAMSELLIEITATVVVARLEQTPEERQEGLTRLRWANAGHPPPVVVCPTADGGGPLAEVLWGSAPNLLLGLEPSVERDENVVTLRRGSTLLFYTDGLVERRGELIDRGIERLSAVLTELIAAGLPLEELCDELLRRMLPDKPDDDVALVAVRLHEED